MKRLFRYTIGIVVSLLPLFSCMGQSIIDRAKRDSIPLYKRTLISAGEIIALNMGVWAFDRYVG